MWSGGGGLRFGRKDGLEAFFYNLIGTTDQREVLNAIRFPPTFYHPGVIHDMNPSAGKLTKRALVVYLAVLLGATFWPFNFFQTNNVSWETGGLRFEEPAIAYTEPFLPGLDTLSGFTLLAHLSADIPGQSSWILSYGLDFDRKNLLVGLYVDQLVVEVNRGGRDIRVMLKDVLERGEATWLAVVFDEGQLSVYLDGTLRRSVHAAFADTVWTTPYPLVIGARSDGKYPWAGSLYRVALLGIPATQQELSDPDKLLLDKMPLIDFGFMGTENRTVANQGTVQTGPLVIPQRFEPFQRATPLRIEELWDPPPIWRDIILNFLVFIPGGALVAALLRPRMGPVSSIILAFLASLLFSAGIEFLQAFLPRRWSTFTDVVTNAAGGLAGALLMVTSWRTGLARRMGLATEVNVRDGTPEEGALQ